MLTNEQRLALLEEGLRHLQNTEEGFDTFKRTGRGSEWRAALKAFDKLAADLSLAHDQSAVVAATSSNESGVTDESEAEIAKRIDRFISGGTWKIRSDPRYAARCPLVGFGPIFVRVGRKHGVDPLFLVAIATHENRLGTFKAIQAKHNTFGLGPGRTYRSWEANIEAAARNLARSGGFYVGKNTIRSIGLTWAPIGAGNDPGDLNQHWVGSVTRFYAELGGRDDHNAVVKTRP